MSKIHCKIKGWQDAFSLPPPPFLLSPNLGGTLVGDKVSRKQLNRRLGQTANRPIQNFISSISWSLIFAPSSPSPWPSAWNLPGSVGWIVLRLPVHKVGPPFHSCAHYYHDKNLISGFERKASTAPILRVGWWTIGAERAMSNPWGNDNFNVIQNIERNINYLLREFEVSFAGGHVPVIGEAAPKTDHAAMNSQQFNPGHQPSCGICLWTKGQRKTRMPWQFCAETEGKNCPRKSSEKKIDPEASIFLWCTSLLFGWFEIWQLTTWTMASFDLTVPPHLGEVVCPAHFRTCTILYQDLFTFSYFYNYRHFWVNPYSQPDCKISVFLRLPLSNTYLREFATTF